MTETDPGAHAGAAGYTLVELSVAVVVALLVGALAYEAYRFVHRAAEVHRHAVVLENGLHLALQRWAADLAYAARLEAPTDTTWILRTDYGRPVRYAYAAGALWRNGVRMHDAEVRTVRFGLRASRPLEPFAPLEASGEADRLRVTVTLTLAGRHDTLSAETTVSVRAHRPWPPLEARE